MGAALAATARTGAAGLAAIPLETARVAAKEAIVEGRRAGETSEGGEGKGERESEKNQVEKEAREKKGSVFLIPCGRLSIPFLSLPRRALLASAELAKKKVCRLPASIRLPHDLQSCALPIELRRRSLILGKDTRKDIVEIVGYRTEKGKLPLSCTPFFPM